MHAKNGKEAIDFCNSNKNIVLVLMDLKMPVINGFDATKTIRTKHSDLKIIAQTAYSSEHDKIKALQAGCNAFITKPVNKTDFKILLEKYLGINKI